jgi:hypothetical protein
VARLRHANKYRECLLSDSHLSAVRPVDDPRGIRCSPEKLIRTLRVWNGQVARSAPACNEAGCGMCEKCKCKPIDD